MVTLKVTGVIPKMKQKSHIQFEALISAATLSSLEKEKKIDEITDNWEEFCSSYVYVLLNKNARQSDLDTALVKIGKLKYPENGRGKSLILQYSSFQDCSWPTACK